MDYTLALAYAGGALPLLIVFAISQRPLADIVTSEVVAVEVVRSLVGAMAARADGRRPFPSRQRGRAGGLYAGLRPGDLLADPVDHR